MFFSPDVALITEDDRKLASLARMSILQGFFLQDHDSAKHHVQTKYLITSSKMNKEITCEILKSRLSMSPFKGILYRPLPFLLFFSIS